MFFTRKDFSFDSYSYLTHSSFPKDPDGDERKLGRCLKANLGWFRDPFVSFYPTEGLSVYSAPYSVQFSHSVLSNCLQSHGLQHARLSCPSPTPGACSNSCPLSQWYHPTILSSVIPFFSCLQSFPASNSSESVLHIRWPILELQHQHSFNINIPSASTVLPMTIQDWFPLGLTRLISLQSKGLSRV